MGGIYGCGYQEVGVVSGWCCKEVQLIPLYWATYVIAAFAPLKWLDQVNKYPAYVV